MLDAVDIMKSVYGTLRTTFPSVKLWDKDIDKIKDQDKPCFVVDFDSFSDGLFNSSYTEQTYTVYVYYFNDDRNNGYADLLNVKKILGKALRNPHNINGFVWQAIDIDYSISREDMTLTAIFDVYGVQDATAEQEENLDIMEELEYDEEEL